MATPDDSDVSDKRPDDKRVAEKRVAEKRLDDGHAAGRYREDARSQATPRVSGRGRRVTPELLKQLRNLRVAVFHPKDSDGETLTGQLMRIGCQVQAFWPPLPELPDVVDVVFCAVRPDDVAMEFNWLKLDKPPAVVAVVGYENPTIVDAMLKIGARGVLSSPLRSSGILSSLVLALSVNEEILDQRKRVARLEQKLLGVNQINEAKAILTRTHGINDAQAYRMIREQAMSKRIATEEIARAIIRADAVLSFRKDSA